MRRIDAITVKQLEDDAARIVHTMEDCFERYDKKQSAIIDRHDQEVKGLIKSLGLLSIPFGLIHFLQVCLEGVTVWRKECEMLKEKILCQLPLALETALFFECKRVVLPNLLVTLMKIRSEQVQIDSPEGFDLLNDVDSFPKIDSLLDRVADELVTTKDEVFRILFEKLSEKAKDSKLTISVAFTIEEERVTAYEKIREQLKKLAEILMKLMEKLEVPADLREVSSSLLPQLQNLVYQAPELAEMTTALEILRNEVFEASVHDIFEISEKLHKKDRLANLVINAMEALSSERLISAIQQSQRQVSVSSSSSSASSGFFGGSGNNRAENDVVNQKAPGFPFAGAA